MKNNLKLENNNDIQKIKEVLDNSKKIILINHRRMDGDCLWSLMWFYEILKKQNKELKVIEWSGAGKKVTRKNFWNKKLGKTPTLIQLENITTFTDWEDKQNLGEK